MGRRAPPFASDAVAAVFATFAPAVRKRLMRLRALIFETAAATEGVGALEETLKWGEPAYLTPATKSGTTVHINRTKADGGYALYVNCQTDLVESRRQRYPQLAYDGTRAILFEAASEPDEDALRHCIAMALTYHRRKRGAR